MTVKMVRKYEAGDGQLFDTMVQAQRHDAKQKVFNGIRAALSAASPGSSIGTLVPDLAGSVTKLTTLRDACNKGLEYHRNNKAKAKATAKT